MTIFLRVRNAALHVPAEQPPLKRAVGQAPIFSSRQFPACNAPSRQFIAFWPAMPPSAIPGMAPSSLNPADRSNPK